MLRAERAKTYSGQRWPNQTEGREGQTKLRVERAKPYSGQRGQNKFRAERVKPN
jgi:hypothetical protein